MGQEYLEESTTNAISAIVAVSPILALITILRLYTRLLVIKNTSRDDLYIGFALVSLLRLRQPLSKTTF